MGIEGETSVAANRMMQMQQPMQSCISCGRREGGQLLMIVAITYGSVRPTAGASSSISSNLC